MQQITLNCFYHSHGIKWKKQNFVASMLDKFISEASTVKVVNSIPEIEEIWNNQQVTK